MIGTRICAATFLVITASLFLSASAIAQDSERRLENALAAAGSEKDAREIVEITMMVRLSKELKLTEEETVLLVRRMTDFRDDINRLQRERRNLLGKMRASSQEKTDEDAIHAGLKKLKDYDQRISDARLGLHDTLSEGLEARQQVRLYVFLQEFEQHMQRMVQRVRERSRALEGGRMGRDGSGRGGRGPGPKRIQRGDKTDSPKVDPGRKREASPSPE